MDFRVMGDLSAGSDGINARLERRILAVVLAFRNQSISQQHLIDLVWEGDPPLRVDDSLFSKVSRLRKVIGPDRLLRTSVGYRLVVLDGECDADRFTTTAMQALGRPATFDIGAAETALQMWREPLFGEFSDDSFVMTERARLERLRDDLEAGLAEALLVAGQASVAAARAELALARHPDHERLALVRARALAASGRTADALRGLHEFRETLIDTTGLEPSASVAELELALLRGEVGPPVEVAATPTPIARAGRRHLPRPNGQLVGRAAELAELARSVRAGHVVSVIGEGGIGKSRLVLEFATEHRQRYDGVVWCSMASLGESAFPSVLRHIARCCVESPSERDLSDDDLLDHIGVDNRLLILDECERSTAAVAEVVRRLSAYDVHVLVTSRTPLRAAGEQVMRLDVLAADGDGSPAVEMIASRLPEAIVNSTRHYLGELAGLTAGLPLALELVAARLMDLPAGTVVDTMRARRPIDGRGGHEPSVREAIAWSYGSLSDDAQTLFRRLCALAGSFDIDLLRPLWPGRPGAEVALLADLLDHGLVRRSALDGRRYEILRPIADAGLAFVETEEERDALDGHAALGVAELLRHVGARRRGPDEAGWVGRIAAEWDNVRGAVESCLRGQRHDLAALLLSLLTEEACFSGRSEVARWAAQLMASVDLDGSPHEPAVAAICAYEAMNAGRFDDAGQLAQRAVDAERNGAETTWLAPTVAFLLAIVGVLKVRPTTLLADLERYSQQHGDPMGTACALFARSFVDVALGRPHRSIPSAIQLHRLARRHDSVSFRAMADFSMGRAVSGHNPVRAAELVARSLDLADSVGIRLVGSHAARTLNDWQAADPAAALSVAASIVERLSVESSVDHEVVLQDCAVLANLLVSAGIEQPAATLLGGLNGTVWSRTVTAELAHQRLAARCPLPELTTWLRAGRRLRGYELLEVARAAVQGRVAPAGVSTR